MNTSFTSKPGLSILVSFFLACGLTVLVCGVFLISADQLTYGQISYIISSDGNKAF